MTAVRIIAVAAALLIGSALYAADDVVRVRKSTGRCEVDSSICVDEAEEKAFMEAKKEALRKAGISEASWALLGHVSPAGGERFHEAYSSVCSLAVDRLVNVLEKKVEEVRESDSVFCEVTIDADVVGTDVAEDPEFKLIVEGIAPGYNDEEIFECSFYVQGADSYLKLFWFTDEEVSMIYPNDFEGDQMFTAGKQYGIPVTDTIELVMARNDPDADAEFINLIFLATRTNCQYTGEMDFHSVLNWIYTIPADQRAIFHGSTLIK